MPDVSTKDIDEYINLSKLFLDKNFDHPTKLATMLDRQSLLIF